MYDFKTKDMYLALIGNVKYDEEKNCYFLSSDESYTVVYYKGKKEVAKEAFSATQYYVFDKIDKSFMHRYKGENIIIKMYSITRFMNVPSDWISEFELVRILNEIDPTRRENINDIVLSMVSFLNKKASNILDESELERFNNRLLELCNMYVSELNNDKGNINLIKQTYLFILLKYDFELSNSNEVDYYDDFKKIKLILSNG